MMNRPIAFFLVCFLAAACAPVQTTTTGSGDCVNVIGTGGDGGTARTGGEGGLGTLTASEIECPFESECSSGMGSPPFAPKQCSDADHLTADRCVDVAPCGGVCAHVPVQCDHYDGGPIQALVCDDGNPCTRDACGPNNACAHEVLPSEKCSP